MFSGAIDALVRAVQAEDPMPTNHRQRVAHRFPQTNPTTSKGAHLWNLPGRREDVPDAVIVGHSQGSTLTSADLKATLSKSHDFVPGSCSFDVVSAKDETNKVTFQVSIKGGRSLNGTVAVNVVAYEDRLLAHSIIEVDDAEGST